MIISYFLQGDLTLYSAGASCGLRAVEHTVKRVHELCSRSVHVSGGFQASDL